MLELPALGWSEIFGWLPDWIAQHVLLSEVVTGLEVAHEDGLRQIAVTHHLLLLFDRRNAADQEHYRARSGAVAVSSAADLLPQIAELAEEV